MVCGECTYRLIWFPLSTLKMQIVQRVKKKNSRIRWPPSMRVNSGRMTVALSMSICSLQVGIDFLFRACFPAVFFDTRHTVAGFLLSLLRLLTVRPTVHKETHTLDSLLSVTKQLKRNSTHTRPHFIAYVCVDSFYWKFWN